MSRHHLDVRGVGRDAVGLERREQLAQQQRVAAGRAGAGGAEALVGVVAEPRARPARATASALSGPGRTERVAGSCAISAISAGSVPGSVLRSVAPTSDRHVLEPADEVGEEAQRRAVAPVQVVHRQQHRPVRRDVRREPVEAVERGERARRLGRRASRVGAPKIGARRRGGAAEPARRGPRRRAGRARTAGARRRTGTRARARCRAR